MKANFIRTALLFALTVSCVCLPAAAGTREMEDLDRGVVAVHNSNASSVFVSWRMLGTEPESVSYNVYRDGVKLNSSPITDSCNWLDSGGSAGSTYRVAAVLDGVEQPLSSAANTWTSGYLGSGQYIGCQRIPLTPRTGYEANDAAVGDLDGDGEYELVLKRLSTTLTTDATAFHYLEAYELDGTLLWAINMGPNELLAPLEINPIVYDFDGDGRAEVVVRTTEGVTDALGNTIGDTDGDGKTDYRSSSVQNGGWQFMTQGPEFLSVFDGQSGKEIARAPYIERDPISQWGLPGQSLGQYAHRADKCMLTPAYLNGTTPSIVITRGIYEKTALEAWDFRDGTLTQLWHFDSDMSGYDGYAQQGNHNLTVGDCDGDGFDEIVYGQMTIDHDGSGLYTTGRGHGDAIHMGKMIPGSDGLQIYGVHEHPPYGADLRDAATGVAIWEHTAGGDTGRGCAAHIDSEYPGYQMWDVGLTGTYDCTTQTKISDNAVNWGNFLIWWDGDLQREILDGTGSAPCSPIIDKWDSVNKWGYRLVSLYNYPSSYSTVTVNHSKANPSLSGDLIGDWREEAIFPASDHSALYIYTTATLTSHRIYTLMHDSMYRTAIAWQCNQYNQPPHPSFYIGAGMDTPPTPDIAVIEHIEDLEPPASPSGLSASSDGTRIQLDWNDNSETDLFGYTVYRSTDAGSTYTAIASDVRTSDFTDSGPNPNITYTYAIAAVDFSENESAKSSSASASAAAGLVAHYKLDSTPTDSSGNGLDATADGSPAYAAGTLDGAIDMDGSDDALTAPANLLNSDDMTIATWVNWNGGNNWQRLFDFGNNTSEYMFITPSSGNSTLRFAIKNGGSEQVVETSALATGQWVHLAVTLSGNTATLYVNGSAAASSASITINPSDVRPAKNYIGKSQYPDPLFNGKIDDFRVYNYALNATQISALANPPAAPTGLTATAGDAAIALDWADNSEGNLSSYTVYRSTASGTDGEVLASGLSSSSYTDSTAVTAAPYYYTVTAVTTDSGESSRSAEAEAFLTAPVDVVAYFRFEEGSAGSAIPAGNNQIVDSVGGDDNMNAYSAAGAPDYSASVPSVTIPQTGTANALSAYFDGDDDIYNSITGPMVTTVYTDFTVEAYVNFSVLDGYQTIVGRDDDWNTSGGVDGNAQSLFYLSKHADNRFRVELSTVGGDMLAFEGTATAAADTWYHVAAVGNAAAGTLTLYVNGESVGSTTGFDGLYPSTTHAWTIGRALFNDQIVDNLTGYVDEVRVSASALAPSQFLNAVDTTDVTAPAAPTGLSAVAGDAQVALDWNDNSDGDLASYTVYRSISSARGYTELASGIAVSDYTDSTALNGRTYYYRVTATDHSGNESENSAYASATPEDVNAPAAPAGLSVGAGDSGIVLDWVDNSEPDLVGYTVYRSTTSGSGYSVAASNLTESTYSDSTVQAAITYWYRVTATDTSANESVFSREFSATADLPGAPAGLSAEAGNTEVVLTWSASDTASSYVVKRATSSEGPYATVTTVSTNSFTDTGLANLTTYWYVVYAVNSFGESADSGAVSATPEAGILKINAGGSAVSPYEADSYVSDGNTWSTTGTIDTSEVTDPAPDEVYLTEHNADFTYSVPGLIPESAYLVRLHFVEIYHSSAGSRLFDVSINGTQVLDDFDIFAVTGARYKAMVLEYSVPANAEGSIDIQFVTVLDNAKVSAIEILPVDAPDAPTGLTATADDSSVELDWDDSGDADFASYTVYRSTVSGSGYSAVASNLTDSAYTDTSVVSEETYYYTVTVTDTFDIESENSEEAEILVMLDTDSDGLSDTWELEHFGSLAQSGTDDPDGDGDSNVTEKLNGTNPGISSIPPEISVTPAEAGLNLNWSTNHIGWTLMSRTNLTSGTWQEVPGSAATNAYENTNASEQVFYRLEYSE